MARRSGDFGPDDRFAVRYVSQGRSSEFLIAVVDLMPSGSDVKIEATFPDSDRKPVRLMASKMSLVVHQADRRSDRRSGVVVPLRVARQIGAG